MQYCKKKANIFLIHSELWKYFTPATLQLVKCSISRKLFHCIRNPFELEHKNCASELINLFYPYFRKH